MARDKQDTEILERGNIYFCYRPKVEHQSVEKLKDVQQFYFVLAPLGIKLDLATETEDTAEILNDIRMRKSRHPIEPLYTKSCFHKTLYGGVSHKGFSRM